MERYTVEVCEECYMALAGVLEDVSEGYTWVPLSQLGDAARVDMGCTRCEPCGRCDAGDAVPACQCDAHGDMGHGFSRVTCGGCGATWAGNRYPVIAEYVTVTA